MKKMLPFLFVVCLSSACKKSVENVTVNNTVKSTGSENAVTTMQNLIFTFDGSQRGWTIEGDAKGYLSATGGNPGGCMYGIDESTGIYWYFKSPASLLDKIKKDTRYSISLKFDLKAPSNGTNEPDIILEAPGYKLVYNMTQNPNAVTWTTFTVPFNDLSAWRKETLAGPLVTKTEMKYVLQNLEKLLIRGEFFVGADTGYLDNVTYE